MAVVDPIAEHDDPVGALADLAVRQARQRRRETALARPAKCLLGGVERHAADQEQVLVFTPCNAGKHVRLARGARMVLDVEIVDPAQRAHHPAERRRRGEGHQDGLTQCFHCHALLQQPLRVNLERPLVAGGRECPECDQLAGVVIQRSESQHGLAQRLKGFGRARAVLRQILDRCLLAFACHDASPLFRDWKAVDRQAPSTLDRALVDLGRQRDILHAGADRLEQRDLVGRRPSRRLADDEL